jgi:tetrahydromethanopterin S-methyltransferase subunit G
VVKRQSDSLPRVLAHKDELREQNKKFEKEENATECVENCEIWGRIVFSLTMDGIFVIVLLLLLLLLYFHIWGYPVCEAEWNIVLEAHHTGIIENMLLSPTLVRIFTDMCIVSWWNIFCYFFLEMLAKDVFSVHTTWSPSSHSHSGWYHLHISRLLQLLRLWVFYFLFFLFYFILFICLFFF